MKLDIFEFYFYKYSNKRKSDQIQKINIYIDGTG